MKERTIRIIVCFCFLSVGTILTAFGGNFNNPLLLSYGIVFLAGGISAYLMHLHLEKHHEKKV